MTRTCISIQFGVPCHVVSCGMVVRVHGVLLAREGAVVYIIKCVGILFKEPA